MKYIIKQEAFAPLLLSTLPPPVAGPMQGIQDRSYRRLQYRTLLEGLAALEDKRERLEELEQDAEAVLEYRTRMAPEALSVLIPKERHQF
jgi:hypothetical protein